MKSPELGCFGLVRTDGFTSVGIRVVTQSPVNHAFIYVGLQTFDYDHGDGSGLIHYENEPAVVEGRPSGSGFAPLKVYSQIIWSDPPPDGKGPAVAAAAIARIGTPYSWVDDACIGLAKIFGWHLPQSVRDRLANPGHSMCSQYVDLCAGDAGWVLYSDHRLPGDVSPGDLLIYILATRAGEVDPCTWRG